MSKKAGFSQAEHLSDIAIKAFAPDVARLFEMTARGMASIISELEEIVPRTQKRVEIAKEEMTGLVLEDLLVLWLEKILFLHESEDLLFCDFHISEIGSSDELYLVSEISGEPIDLKRHSIHTHIKAPTYHGLHIEKDQKKGLFTVQVIFDI